ncbi:MAG: hypothetical protein DRI90_11900 [Deltaproteobacteria bacterium]|nr:MAG: hypothetical protein DRI90_11900 [Deltaproteobacteria bacterium]
MAALFVAASLAVAGCGVDSVVAEFCAELCDCEDCNDAELETCEIKSQRTLDIAENQGCDDDFLDFLDCITSKNDCEDDEFEYSESCYDESDDYYDCRDSVPIDW